MVLTSSPLELAQNVLITWREFIVYLEEFCEYSS
jgi:hypothetical protein